MIHHIFANRSNIGDWLSAKGIQSCLGSAELREHLCDEPFVDETLAELSPAGPHDMIVVGGGGLFMDYFTPLWKGLRSVVERVPLCIWGVGYCDLKAEPSRPSPDLLREVVERARLVVVRDEMTRGHLAGCSLPAPVPCPSITVVDRQPVVARGLLHVDNYTTVGPDMYEFMDNEGRAFARKTDRVFRTTNNRIQDGDAVALRRTLDLYAKSDLVISSALHGCVIAVAMGRRVLAVSGDTKIEGFMELAGLGDWVCDRNERDHFVDTLRRLPEQSLAPEFVDRAKTANRAVGGKILEIAAQVGQEIRYQPERRR